MRVCATRRDAAHNIVSHIVARRASYAPRKKFRVMRCLEHPRDAAHDFDRGKNFIAQR
jgi:hypothetical protein